MAFANGPGIVACLPFPQYDSEAAVGEKRPAPDSAQELPGPSVGVLPLHMIEEETVSEDGNHAQQSTV